MNDIKNSLNLFFEECFYLILRQEQQYIQEEFGDLSINEVHLIAAASRLLDTKSINISKSLGITAGSLTVAAKVLINKGYLLRRQDKVDKRIYRLYLTQKGQEINRIHNKYHSELVDKVINGLDAVEITALERALEKIKEFTKINEN